MFETYMRNLMQAMRKIECTDNMAAFSLERGFERIINCCH